MVLKNGMRLIFLGPPGAGKGTIAKIMESSIGIKQISTGDILRAAIKSGDELGQKVKSYIEAGDLVPDEVMIALVDNYLASNTFESGFILDGFPRTLKQAEELDHILSKLEMKLDGVVFIEVEEDEIIRRITSRRTCSNPDCQAIYNIRYDPPKQEGICDICGSELIVREDETEEVVKHRLNVYQTQTSPLIRYYQKKGLLKPYSHPDSARIAQMIIQDNRT